MTKYNVNVEFEIISSFYPKDRLNELKEIPKTPDDDIDYWKVAELLCEKDGGRLAATKELQLIAALQKNKLIDTNYSGFFWSSSPYSNNAYYAWYVYFNDCNAYYDFRDYGNRQALCVK